MKFKLSLTVPSEAEVVAGLSVDADPGLARARTTLQHARVESDRARQQLVDAGVAIDHLKSDVAAGRRPIVDLEGALRSREALALTMPKHEQRAAAAAAEVERAAKDARQSVVAEASRRAAELQAVADQLAPVLEAIAIAESALDEMLLRLGERNGVKPVTWPQCLEDAGGMFTARQ